MNSLTRIQNTLTGGPVDRIPVVPIFMAWAAEYAGHTYGEFQWDYRALTASLLKVRERFHIDQLTTLSDPHRETADYGAKVTYQEHSVCRCEGPLIQNPSDVNKLRRMPIDAAPRMLDRIHALEVFHREMGGDVSILGWLEGPLAEFCTLRTLETAMTDLLTEPDLFHEACSVTMDNAVTWARDQIHAGADMIGVGDSAVSLVSAEMYREHILPWHQRLFHGIHDAGGKVRLHICGAIDHLIPDIVHAGVDVLDIDWMVDLAQARQIVGDKVTLFGQFDPVRVLKEGTPEDVTRAARENIRDGGPKHFGLMPGCEIPPGTPEENIAAFCPGEGCLMAEDLTVESAASL